MKWISDSVSAKLFSKIFRKNLSHITVLISTCGACSLSQREGPRAVLFRPKTGQPRFFGNNRRKNVVATNNAKGTEIGPRSDSMAENKETEYDTRRPGTRICPHHGERQAHRFRVRSMIIERWKEWAQNTQTCFQWVGFELFF